MGISADTLVLVDSSSKVQTDFPTHTRYMHRGYCTESCVIQLGIFTSFYAGEMADI